MKPLDSLRAAFADVFGVDATHLARAPGRVNLLGEHVDYNGLGVLPMALQREVRLVFRPRDDGRVNLANPAFEFDDVTFELSPALEPEAPGAWGNYCRAPAWELARRFAIWRGLDGVLESSVPVAAGLSSSSAVVNAVGLALAYVNEVEMDPLSFASWMADAERFTGTRGGGMDQAISIGARAGHAALIEFDPLRMRHIMIPEDWCFVVADTGVRAEKSGAAQAAYNRRREECEMALDGVSQAAVDAGLTVTRVDSYRALLQRVEHGALLELAEATLEGALARRFRHVVTEARRVREGVDLLVSADPYGFGLLMDASHGSLHGDFQVSCPELDELVDLAREGGAVGARLTGAGFGGCAVALAERGAVDEVLEALIEGYYAPRGLSTRLEDRLFVAVPSQGASVAPL